jgi:hypothetical protein
MGGQPVHVVTESEMMEVPQIRKIQNSIPSHINADKSELYNLLAQRGDIQLMESEKSDARHFSNQAVANLMAQENLDLEKLNELPFQEQIKIFRDVQANHYKALDMSKRLMKSSQIDYNRFDEPLSKLNQISKIL